MSASKCYLSFYQFISNTARFPLPPSSLHSLNFVLLLCLLCCHTVWNPFFSFLFFSYNSVDLSVSSPYLYIYRTFFPQSQDLSCLKCLFLGFSASPSYCLSPTLPSLLSLESCSFYLGLKWMVFLRKSVADCCRARGPACHCSRLIYPQPLSSCYAWSLNFPFLLFFPCFFSQIPPLTLPDPPHPSALIFLSCRPILSEHDTCSIHATGFIFSLWAYSKICHVRQLLEPECDVQCTHAHLRTLLRIRLYSLPLFLHRGPYTVTHKGSLHATVCIINCEVMAALYSPCLTSH